MSGLPDYIVRGGEQAMRQPYVIDGIEFYGFVLDAERTALDALVKRQLTDPTGGRWVYAPLVSKVICSFYRVRCNHQLDPNVGWMPTKEVAFFVPVARMKPEGLVESIGWTIPYIVVNDGWAMASGREVFGVPKEMGSVVLPESAQNETRCQVDTLVMERFHPDCEACVRTLAEVQQVDGGPQGAAGEAWQTVEDALRGIAKALFGTLEKLELPGLGLVVEVWNLIRHHEVPLVFLKQFRDIADAGRACYQAVCEAPAKITSFQKGHLLPGDYEVNIAQYDSHPLQTDLGLAPQSRPGFSFYLEFGFTLGNGKAM